MAESRRREYYDLVKIAAAGGPVRVLQSMRGNGFDGQLERTGCEEVPSAIAVTLSDVDTGSWRSKVGVTDTGELLVFCQLHGGLSYLETALERKNARSLLGLGAAYIHALRELHGGAPYAKIVRRARQGLGDFIEANSLLVESWGRRMNAASGN